MMKTLEQFCQEELSAYEDKLTSVAFRAIEVMQLNKRFETRVSELKDLHPMFIDLVNSHINTLGYELAKSGVIQIIGGIKPGETWVDILFRYAAQEKDD